MVIGIGYDISIIKAKSEYKKAGQIIQIGKDQTTVKIRHIVSEPTVVIVDKDKDYIEEYDSDSFEPTYTPDEFDHSKISVAKKEYLNVSQLVRTEHLEIKNQEVREEVGRWSEEFVYKILSEQNIFSKIEWVNKGGESGLPYDFKVIENGIEKYIDAKGTPSSGKDIVYLSPNEWIFMFDKGEIYSIYRIYDAGKSTARIETIENPSDLLIKGKIFPHPITLQI
ncbi:hypothetical protein EZS27_013604 [termite gut metagenome]|uniref:Protein NO VEIN C-terminal domain-containing protein n=1 Tax=termite gut metagenome TaxID=433724 RepID=A0A5J4RZG9_9ZZZZ